MIMKSKINSTVHPILGWFFLCVFLLVLEGILMTLSRPGKNNNGKKSFKAQNYHDECMETFDHNFLCVCIGLIIDKY